jgi:hypothetical protein
MSKIQIKDLSNYSEKSTALSARELQTQGGIIDVGLLISVGQYVYREGIDALNELGERLYG